MFFRYDEILPAEDKRDIDAGYEQFSAELVQRANAIYPSLTSCLDFSCTAENVFSLLGPKEKSGLYTIEMFFGDKNDFSHIDLLTLRYENATMATLLGYEVQKIEGLHHSQKSLTDRIQTTLDSKKTPVNKVGCFAQLYVASPAKVGAVAQIFVKPDEGEFSQYELRFLEDKETLRDVELSYL